MKKYLIICDSKEAARKVNDLISINSLFTKGETITEYVVRWGRSYTDDERVYNAVCAYIQEGGADVRFYNLRKFDFKKDNIKLYKDAEGSTQIRRFGTTVYHIEVAPDSITVNGYSMKIKIKSGHTYNLLKTYIGVSQIEDFAYFIQDERWKHSGCPAAICKHVITYGKYCA